MPRASRTVSKRAPNRKAVTSDRDAVASIDRMVDAISAALSRAAVLFPAGLSQVHINVELADGTSASVQLHGIAGMPAEPGRVPESCKGAGIYTSGGDDLKLGEKVPNKSETAVSGAIAKKITRKDAEFANLVENQNADIVFKDEEGTRADRMMTQKLSDALDTLAVKVAAEWNKVNLRVTEAWDEDDEHAGNSLHYEGRAADLTTSPVDSAKLGRLGRLAVEAGFDWVWYENSAHIHVSVMG